MCIACLELVPEERDRRGDRRGGPVAEGAERAAEDVLAQVEQLLDVALLAPGRPPSASGSAPATRCPRGTGCTCRRTRACRTRSSAAPSAPPRWSRRSTAAPWCRASTSRWPRPRSPAGCPGAPRSASASTSRPGVQNFSSVPLPDAAGQIEQLAQRDAQRRLELARGWPRARTASRWSCPWTSRCPSSANQSGPLAMIARHRGDRLDVVDHRRAGVQAGDRPGTAAAAAAGRAGPPASPAARSPRRRCTPRRRRAR